MTQLERMKKYVINQIEIMTPREFLKFTDMISGDFEVEKIINLSELFTCTDCKEKYGECYIEDTGLEECYQRYEKYCIEKV